MKRGKRGQLRFHGAASLEDESHARSQLVDSTVRRFDI